MAQSTNISLFLKQEVSWNGSNSCTSLRKHAFKVWLLTPVWDELKDESHLQGKSVSAFIEELLLDYKKNSLDKNLAGGKNGNKTN